MIEAIELTKRYGDRVAVDALSFRVEPGTVTGFLGPNGAGKSTTMRMVLGLDAPTSGTVRVNGRAYAQHPAPLREVGALLDGRAVHPARTARNHLRALAATTGISRARVEEVIDRVGLQAVADRRAGSFSLGMGQRLGLAAALLGDPRTLLLDEPVNGLDPDGVRWIRTLLRELAAEGRTVLLSSHLMSEMALTADRLIIIGQGRLLRDTTVAAVVAEASPRAVRVRTADPDALRDELEPAGASVTEAGDGGMTVTGMSSDEIGFRASDAGLTLFELTPLHASLEEAYMALTDSVVEYRPAAELADAVAA